MYQKFLQIRIRREILRKIGYFSGPYLKINFFRSFLPHFLHISGQNTSKIDSDDFLANQKVGPRIKSYKIGAFFRRTNFFHFFRNHVVPPLVQKSIFQKAHEMFLCKRRLGVIRGADSESAIIFCISCIKMQFFG